VLGEKGGTAARGNASSSLVTTRKQTVGWITPSIGEASLASGGWPVWTAESVLVCALTLLGRSERSFPPIEFVNAAPAEALHGTEAFARVNDRHIYVVTSSPLFRRLQQMPNRCGDLESVRKLASVLIHEEAHVVRGADESDAYAAQLTTLAALGAGPGTPVFADVRRSMRHAQAPTRRAGH